MHMNIDELVAKKPHLTDLFRFYERTTAFNREVRELLSRSQAFPARSLSDLKIYFDDHLYRFLRSAAF
jgi:hypothetical protein